MPRPKWAALLEAFLFSRLILIIRMMSSKTFYREILHSRYSKGRIDALRPPKAPGLERRSLLTPEKGCGAVLFGTTVLLYAIRRGLAVEL